MTTQTGDKGVVLKSDCLRGKRIALGICGGIGAVETVRAVRELRRYAAEVKVFVTPQVSEFVGLTSLAWASNAEVVEQPGPDVSYLESYDLVVIAPLTLNTLSKIALGVTDNAVTLLVASQLGRKGKLLLIPAMNVSLRMHPLCPAYLGRLREWGATVLETDVEEERVKLPSAEKISEFVLALLK